MKRLVRFATLAAIAAAIVAAVKALTRQDDPLPTPASEPSAPWPPLRAEPTSSAPSSTGSAGSSAPAEPAPAPDAPVVKPATKPVKKTAAKPAKKPATTSPAKSPAKSPTTSKSEPATDDVVVPEPDGVPVAQASSAQGAAWAEPTDDGDCPAGFPIKAKLRSKIFHAPGQLHYDRTTPDRCYASADAAEADGLRAAKR